MKATETGKDKVNENRLCGLGKCLPEDQVQDLRQRMRLFAKTWRSAAAKKLTM